jgi:hypothetical protein
MPRHGKQPSLVRKQSNSTSSVTCQILGTMLGATDAKLRAKGFCPYVPDKTDHWGHFSWGDCK